MIKINNKLLKNTKLLSKALFSKELAKCNEREINYSLSRAIIAEIEEEWTKCREECRKERCAYYLSAEFLMGRMINNNLLCLDIEDEAREVLGSIGKSTRIFESIEDEALGNGGLGRLAACFLDSGASLGINLFGYGIRYRHGLFSQKIENGHQAEYPALYNDLCNAWQVRRNDIKYKIYFKDLTVTAVAYDMPIMPYKSGKTGTLRLWSAESEEPFDFKEFSNGNYTKALEKTNECENISRLLYPNDSHHQGKKLRFMQEYFLASACVQDIIENFKNHSSMPLEKISELVCIQLNDTHPVISVCEFIRIMCEHEGLSFDDALSLCKNIFNYTNHTVMPEALEKWDLKLIEELVPSICEILEKINTRLLTELEEKGVSEKDIEKMKIIRGGTVHMANLAFYCSERVNGVAEIHTELIKKDTFKEWNSFDKNKIVNKTNGITPRRWLLVCNTELCTFYDELCSFDCAKDLSCLKRALPFASNDEVLERFALIKRRNKEKLASYVFNRDMIKISPDTIFDVQIKRLHEYKRQMLNALAILELCFEIKEKSLLDFYPTTFIFAAKAAPGYDRAKGIIKLINEISRYIEKDSELSEYIKVVFLSDYDVSYAEKIVAGAEVSEQISSAGTEASGTGNMKLSLNGAVTIGTYDGANIEIVREAGEENNYIFGKRVEELEQIKGTYNPLSLFESNPKIKRTLSCLTDGTLSDDGCGIFRELYNSILFGGENEPADKYFLLCDFEDYLNAKIRLNRDYKSKKEFTKKCFINSASSGRFSSDRTIKEYAEEIWRINPNN